MKRIAPMSIGRRITLRQPALRAYRAAFLGRPAERGFKCACITNGSLSEVRSTIATAGGITAAARYEFHVLKLTPTRSAASAFETFMRTCHIRTSLLLKGRCSSASIFKWRESIARSPSFQATAPPNETECALSNVAASFNGASSSPPVAIQPAKLTD